MPQPIIPGVYPQPAVTAPKNGQIRGQNPSVLHSIAIWGNTSGTSLLSSRATIDAAGNLVTPGTINGRSITADGAILDALAAAVAARLPTQGQKDALVGTDGTPSGANPFVTTSDPRLSGGGGGGVPTSRQIIAGAGLVGGGTLASDVTVGVAAHADGSIIVNADNIQVGIINATQHGNLTGGALHAVATTSTAGFMSAASFTKVDYWLNVLDYGADPTGTLDSWQAFTDAMNAIPISGTGSARYGILIPPGLYVLSKTWMVSRPVQIRGGSARAAANRGTQILGRKGFDVIRVQYSNHVIAGGAAGSFIEQLAINHQSGTGSWVANTVGYVANQSAVLPTTGYNGHWDNYDIGAVDPPFVLRCVKTGNAGASEPDWTTIGYGIEVLRLNMVRVSNVVTVTTPSPHGFTTGNSKYIRSEDPNFTSGFYTITVTGATTFTYAETAANATSGVSCWVADVIDDGTTAWIKVYVAGLKLEAGCTVQDVSIGGIGGDGFSVYAGSGNGTNANTFRFRNSTLSSNAGWGAAIVGFDANGGIISGCFSIQNGWGGFVDASVLGNTYIACGCENNGLGKISVSPLIGPGIVVPDFPATNRSAIFGTYLEGGQRCLINAGAALYQATGGDAFGQGVIQTSSRSNQLVFQNDTNDDGSGNSVTIRIGQPGTLKVMEFAYSQNSNIATGYALGVINGGGSGAAGWVGFGTSTATNWAASLAIAAEGAGHLWIPNTLVRGNDAIGKIMDTVGVGPPSSGAFTVGHLRHEFRPDITGAAMWKNMQAGSPGLWGGIFPTKAVSISGSTSLNIFTTHVACTASNLTITLPAIPSQQPDGREVTILDESGTASATPITIQPTSPDTIEGLSSTNYIFDRSGGSVTFVIRGGSWWVKNEDGHGQRTRATNYTLTLIDAYRSFNTTGAGAQVVFTLPATPRVGMWYEFDVIDSDGLRVLAQGSHVIRNWHDVSGAAGYTESLDVGASIRVQYMGSNIWFCKHIVGTWTTV